jgi:nitrile hydratase
VARVEHRFAVGQPVRVREECPGGNPRTPDYLKGKLGVIAALCGVIENPSDHRATYPYLYTVAFDVAELFGEDSRDKVYADVHEEWLEPA